MGPPHPLSPLQRVGPTPAGSPGQLQRRSASCLVFPQEFEIELEALSPQGSCATRSAMTRQKIQQGQQREPVDKIMGKGQVQVRGRQPGHQARVPGRQMPVGKVSFSSTFSVKVIGFCDLGSHGYLDKVPRVVILPLLEMVSYSQPQRPVCAWFLGLPHLELHLGHPHSCRVTWERQCHCLHIPSVAFWPALPEILC